MKDELIYASDLEPGETTRVLCNRCGGGSSQEHSLTITLDYDGGVVWNCFRDRCDNKGRSGGNLVVQSTTPKEKKVKRFEGSTVPLPDPVLARIKQRWGIENPPYWYWTNDYGGRVAMSIRSPKYMHRGWVLRDLRGVARAKALTYIEPDEVQVSWYKVNDDAPCVVVEDIPSAVRVSMCGVNAVALLGTIVNEDKAIELRDYAPRPICLALDNDAVDKAFKITRKYGLMWDKWHVVFLKKDFKDMSDEEIQNKLGEIL